MKKDEKRRSRRDFIAAGGLAGAGFGLSRFIPNEVFAQNIIKGKESLIVHSVRPEDLETPVGLLKTWITPNDLFYVRHHTYAPTIDEAAAKEWSVKVDGEVERPLTISLDELKKMARATV